MMRNDVPCRNAENGEVVHRYVAGTLPPDELERFEVHLLDCTACQEAVRESATLRAALRRGAVGDRRSRALAWAAPLAAAAAMAVWLLLPSEGSLERLGRVDEVPGFAGLAVRSGADSAAALADDGMAAYGERDYERAAELLSAAVARGASSPGVAFFLGIARLQSGSPDEALRSFAAALEPPDNPYAAEAHFYSAKAWLQLANADSVLAHLAAVPPSVPELHARSSALADSVREALR
jgi:tetratricopeptide (TPR) repeat protein